MLCAMPTRLPGDASRRTADPAALQREAVCVDVQRREKAEIRGPALAVAARRPAPLRLRLQAPERLPLGPVVPGRALDLVSGGGDAPEKRPGRVDGHIEERG